MTSVLFEEYVNQCIKDNLVHSIHTSERRSFRGCRRRWDWIFRQRYYPLVTAKPLEFGVAFHKAMEAFYSPTTWHDKEVAAALSFAAFTKVCKEQYQAYLKLNKGNIDPGSKADYDERILLGQGMLRYYTKYVSPHHDKNFKPVKVEIEFEVPIRDPQGNYVFCKCERCWKRWSNSEEGIKHHDEWQVSHHQELVASGLTDEEARYHVADENYYRYQFWQGLPITYGGRIDMLAEDELGRYWVFDWKTAARMSSGEPGSDDDYLLLDDQITSYCWALWTLGIPVAGFVYAEIKKAVPEEPEPLKQQRKGRWYSVNKQINTTHEMYYKTVSEGDPQGFSAGAYDEFLEYLKSTEGPRYHLRHEVLRSEIELEEAGFNIYQEAMDLTNPNLRIYPSAGRFTCNGCAFREPCLMKNRREDYMYTLDTLFEKKTRAYYEKEPSTDSKGGE